MPDIFGEPFEHLEMNVRVFRRRRSCTTLDLNYRLVAFPRHRNWLRQFMVVTIVYSWIAISISTCPAARIGYGVWSGPGGMDIWMFVGGHDARILF